MAWGYWSSFSLRPRNNKRGRSLANGTEMNMAVHSSLPKTVTTTTATTSSAVFSTQPASSVNKNQLGFWFPAEELVGPPQCRCHNCCRQNAPTTPSGAAPGYRQNLQPIRRKTHTETNANKVAVTTAAAITPCHGPGPPIVDHLPGNTFTPNDGLAARVPPWNQSLGAASRQNDHFHTHQLPHHQLNYRHQPFHQPQQQDSASPVANWCIGCRPCRSRSLKSRSRPERQEAGGPGTSDWTDSYRRTASFPDMDVQCRDNSEWAKYWHQHGYTNQPQSAALHWFSPRAAESGPLPLHCLDNGSHQHFCSFAADQSFTPSNVWCRTPCQPRSSCSSRQRPRAASMEELPSSDNQQQLQQLRSRRKQMSQWPSNSRSYHKPHRVYFACPRQ